MKRIMMILGMMLGAACGGEIDSYEAEPEFETYEQDVRSDPEMGFRTNISGSDTRCLATPDSVQNCVLPPDETFTFRVTGANMSASQKTEVESRVDDNIFFWTDNAAGARDVPAMWTLSRITSGNADVGIDYGTLSGSTKTSIHTYARMSTVPQTPLDDGGRTGSWNEYGAMRCTIDNTKITADFTSPERPRVRNHAIAYCMTKALGIGSGGHFSRPYAIAVTKDAFKSTNFAAKPRCWLTNYVTAGSDYIPFDPPLCSGLADN